MLLLSLGQEDRTKMNTSSNTNIIRKKSKFLDKYNQVLYVNCYSTINQDGLTVLEALVNITLSDKSLKDCPEYNDLKSFINNNKDVILKEDSQRYSYFLLFEIARKVAQTEEKDKLRQFPKYFSGESYFKNEKPNMLLKKISKV